MVFEVLWIYIYIRISWVLLNQSKYVSGVDGCVSGTASQTHRVNSYLLFINS